MKLLRLLVLLTFTVSVNRNILTLNYKPIRDTTACLMIYFPTHSTKTCWTPMASREQVTISEAATYITATITNNVETLTTGKVRVN